MQMNDFRYGIFYIPVLGILAQYIHNGRDIYGHRAIAGASITAHTDPDCRAFQGLLKLSEMEEANNLVRAKIHCRIKGASAGTGSALKTAHTVGPRMFLQGFSEPLFLISQHNGPGFILCVHC
jgi:hypothetical protein